MRVKRKHGARQRRFPRIGHVQREILTELSGGDIFVGFLLSGRSSKAMIRVARERALRRYRDKCAIERLEAFDYVRIQGERLSITEKGRGVLGEIVDTTRKTLDNRKWDGTWRIVIFDIPEIYASLRDKVRMILKQAGFQQLQRSVWVFPHECEELVQFIRQEPKLARYVLYGALERIEGGDILRKKFRL